MRNRLENYPKLKNIIKKAFIFILIFLSIICIRMYKVSSGIPGLNNNISNLQLKKSQDEIDLKKLENAEIENTNLSFLKYAWWMENMASKASQHIYKYTSDLKILSDKSQKELEKISMANIIAADKNNFDNLVKFIIIDKKQGTFITNERDDISFIKDNIKNFSEENGQLFDYVSKKGNLYNISYDSNLSPAGRSGVNTNIGNPKNYVEAYWFPNNYEYKAEDYQVIESVISSYKNSLTQEINIYNSSINNMINEKLSMEIQLAIYIILSVFIFFLFYLLGLNEIRFCINNNIISKFIMLIENWFESRSTLFKMFFFMSSTFVILFLLCFTFISKINVINIVSFPVLLYLAFIFPNMIKFCRYLDKIIKGTEIITGGDISYVIKEAGDRALIKLAYNINKINKGFKVSIEDQIKNEKLKSELVANVSHDLKTPLTSIINYTDILLREDISEEEKTEFIKILNRKSLKLKTLIEDLFEISKINSGKEEIKKEEVDVVELLKQAISEYSDSELYKDKNLNFILKTYDKKISINLDGNKMSRVFENLINNALKYSVNNTRVYVSAENIGKGIKISFKNVSSSPLDFDKSEIFERFARGDKSRNSSIEGSGLGLAIAKSIVELHGGIMYIDFDGDLFKVIIELHN